MHMSEYARLCMCARRQGEEQERRSLILFQFLSPDLSLLFLARNNSLSEGVELIDVSGFELLNEIFDFLLSKENPLFIFVLLNGQNPLLDFVRLDISTNLCEQSAV